MAESQNERLLSWELLIEEELSKLQACSWLTRCFMRVDSTMLRARELLRELSGGQYGLVLSSEQLAGRGRQGRSWLAPQQGFFATYILACETDLSKLQGFSLVVGLLLSRYFEELGAELLLKWPNDVLSKGGDKLSGVLIEIVSDQNKHHLLVGIGINLKGSPPGLDHCTSLEALGAHVPQVTSIAAALAAKLQAIFPLFLQNGFAAFRSAWQERAWRLGADCLFSLENGQNFEGRFVGLSEQGEFILESGAKQQAFASGSPVFGK